MEQKAITTATVTVTTTEDVVLDEPIYDSNEVVHWLIAERDAEWGGGWLKSDIVNMLIDRFCEVFRASSRPREDD